MPDSNERANRRLKKGAARKQDRGESIEQIMRVLEKGRKEYSDSLGKLIRDLGELQDNFNRDQKKRTAEFEAGRKRQAEREKNLEKRVKAAMDKRR